MFYKIVQVQTRKPCSQTRVGMSSSNADGSLPAGIGDIEGDCCCGLFFFFGLFFFLVLGALNCSGMRATTTTSASSLKLTVLFFTSILGASPTDSHAWAPSHQRSWQVQNTCTHERARRTQGRESARACERARESERERWGGWGVTRETLLSDSRL